MERIGEQPLANNNEKRGFEKMEEERRIYIKEVEEKIKEAERRLDESEAAKFRLVKEILGAFTAEEIDRVLEKANQIRESQDI